MARFNEILAGRFNRALQKLTNIKGAASTPQLATEIIPTFPMFYGAEARYLESWNLHSWLVNFGASAAQTNAAMLRNPAGSNIIAVFIKVLVSSQTGAQQYVLSLGPRTTDLPTPSPIPAPSNFDRRFGSSNRSNLISSIQQAAGPGTAPPDRAWIDLPSVSASQDYVNDGVQEFPLLPGDAISVRTLTVNTGDVMSFWWRERPMEDSELI